MGSVDEIREIVCWNLLELNENFEKEEWKPILQSDRYLLLPRLNALFSDKHKYLFPPIKVINTDRRCYSSSVFVLHGRFIYKFEFNS